MFVFGLFLVWINSGSRLEHKGGAREDEENESGLENNSRLYFFDTYYGSQMFCHISKY